MLRSIAPALALFIAGTSCATAGPAEDTCAALMEARGHLVAMLGSSDKAQQEDLKGKIQAASAKVDSMLGGMAGSDAAKANAFKPIWEDFKKTRETEIVPAIQAGKVAEAKAIAGGIQAERMGKMKAAMGCQ